VGPWPAIARERQPKKPRSAEGTDRVGGEHGGEVDHGFVDASPFVRLPRQNGCMAVDVLEDEGYPVAVVVGPQQFRGGRTSGELGGDECFLAVHSR
jgi:hypothetical protein